LAKILPSVRGKLSFDVPLAPYTWLRVGGAAQAFFIPKDEADLAHFQIIPLRNRPPKRVLRGWNSMQVFRERLAARFA